MAEWDREREEQVIEYTSRTCRRCGRQYVWPKGSRRPNSECPTCAPELPFVVDGIDEHGHDWGPV